MNSLRVGLKGVNMNIKRIEKEKAKCIQFLLKNGFKHLEDSVYVNDYIAVGFEEKNKFTVCFPDGCTQTYDLLYYSLLGWLIDYRQISFNFKSV